MKKRAMKASGILTLILYILLSVVAIFIGCLVLEIEFFTKLVSSSEVLGRISFLVAYLFIEIPAFFLVKVIPLGLGLTDKILSIIFVVFSLFMIFWGAKELSISKLDDEDFAKRKKTCGFMMFFKFMIFAFFSVYAVLTFIDPNVSSFNTIIGLSFGFENIFAYLIILLAVWSLVIFLLPAINLSKASKFFKKIQRENPPLAKAENNIPVQQPNPYSSGPQTMQANLPPLNTQTPDQQLNSSQPENLQKEVSVQTQKLPGFQPQITLQSTNSSRVVPGQNGVPQNINAKGIADLERLERLKASKAITEENYNLMRNKIINTNFD